jgi:acyl-CoA reductase-like NAD-dependent aldehyde dehydrogenase
MFANNGEYCMGMKRIYIHENIYDQLRDELVEYAKTIKVGDPLDPSVGVGPVQNKMQYEKVK